MKILIVKPIYFFLLFFILMILWSFDSLDFKGKLINRIENFDNQYLEELSEMYKPIVVFDSSEVFFPLRFDELPNIILEHKRKIVQKIELNDSILFISNNLKSPFELFDKTIVEKSNKEKLNIYYSSLSTKPKNWFKERRLVEFPETIPVYVNFIKDSDYVKIIYTLAFEGNYWNNYHRGDGAMYAIYFERNNKELIPIKTRAYMHLQFMEKDYDESIVKYEGGKKSIFFVTPGGHSTYHLPGKYKNVDGIPIINHYEEVQADVWYSPANTELIFYGKSRNNIEKWAFQGEVYWGGSFKDRIFSENSIIGKIPLIKRMPLGNSSAKMTDDPSAVFDKKKFKGELIEAFDYTIPNLD